MAEQEVIKHTKKIYKSLTDKEQTFWHKAKEFTLEVFIIVFAVSISIWFHSMSEHSHQQKDVKEFLLGLKNDLRNDLKEMKEDRKMYVSNRTAFAYLTAVGTNGKLNADSLKLYGNFFFNATGLLANNGRYEGFKSSGKIGTIENLELQNDIMDLYQENIPTLIAFTNYHSDTKAKFTDYYNENYKRSGKGDNLAQILVTDRAQNIAADLGRVNNIIRQYDKCIQNIDKIYQQITLAYPNE